MKTFRSAMLIAVLAIAYGSPARGDEVVNSADGTPIGNTSTSAGNDLVMALDNGQAYLVYGNLVQATSSAVQTVSGVTVNVINGQMGTSNVTQSSSTMSGSVGTAYGSGVVQISNSATAVAVGGNY